MYIVSIRSIIGLEILIQEILIQLQIEGDFNFWEMYDCDVNWGSVHQ